MNGAAAAASAATRTMAGGRKRGRMGLDLFGDDPSTMRFGRSRFGAGGRISSPGSPKRRAPRARIGPRGFVPAPPLSDPAFAEPSHFGRTPRLERFQANRLAWLWIPLPGWAC